MSRDGLFRFWWTRQEYARDNDTRTHAIIEEGMGGFKWRVHHDIRGELGQGTSTTQKGARAACRRAVRKLKLKPCPPTP